jgi:hypothetical protein
MPKLKSSTFVAMLLALSLSVIASQPAVGSLTKPSIPEFTVTYVDNSYDVPPATTSWTDPYTGKTTTSTVPGYYVENKSIQITITNQPFTSYKDENGSYVALYYDIMAKGHFEEEWHNGNPSMDSYCLYSSNSSTTVISEPISNISDGAQIDFQIRALIGTYSRVYGTPVPPFGTPYHDVFVGVGEASDWSDTHTITILAPALSQTLSTSIIGVGVALVLVGIVLLAYSKKSVHGKGEIGRTRK